MILLFALEAFLLIGLAVLFLILWTYLKNWEKPLAMPLFVIGIAVYMVSALLLGRYLPELF